MLVGHKQVTDAQLLTVAHLHGARLVSFDRGLANLIPAEINANELLLVL